MNLSIFDSFWTGADLGTNLDVILNFGLLIARNLEQNGIGLANWIRFYFYCWRRFERIHNGRQYGVIFRFKYLSCMTLHKLETKFNCQVTIKLSKTKHKFDAKIKGNIDCCIYLPEATEAVVCRFFFLSRFSFTNIHDS